MNPRRHGGLAVRRLTIALPPGGDRRLAVEDVSLSVEPGELLCLTGESGSGKSAIALACMQLLPAGLTIQSGSIGVGGKEVVGLSESRMRELRGSKVAMVFQESLTALNPTMRCGRQVDEVVRKHTGAGERERWSRVLAMLEEVGFPDPERIARSYPHQLSGGQRQRVMIAAALILEPEVLIADEPTTALDVTTQAQILSVIGELRRRHGTATLFITHDFGVVSEIADRVAVLQAGRLVEAGACSDVLVQPRHPYTCRLLAALPGLVPPKARPVPAGDVVLAVEGGTKTFSNGSWLRRRSQIALNDVTLALRRGEVLGVVGESGSGKTTLARCLAGLDTLDAGRVLLMGEERGSARSPWRKSDRRVVQFVFQDPYRSFNPRIRLGGSLSEGPRNFGVPAADATQAARRLLETVRIDPRAIARFPHEFSGGQRQRLSLARALTMQPSILIADEPVSALDISVQAEVLDLLRSVRDRFGLSILFITHDLRVAAQLCDRIAVMRNGRVLEAGSTETIFTAPRHEYTRLLLASAPGRDLPAFPCRDRSLP